MKKYITVALIFAVFAVAPVYAETLNLTTLPVLKANGYYVGAVGGYITGGTKANYYCDDFATSTAVPSSFTVLVSTLSDISGTKFSSQTDALKKYQQVGWLMYQMEINPTKTAAIQVIRRRRATRATLTAVAARPRLNQGYVPPNP